MSLKYSILGVLAARPMTGYELSQLFSESTGWLWTASHSQIYPLLNRLVGQGLIVGSEDVKGSNLRRTVYELSAAGLDDLLHWVGSDHGVPKANDPFLVQAVFFDMVPPEAARAVLQAYATGQRDAAETAAAHAARLQVGDTPLIRERLARRDPAEHERIKQLKSITFTGQADVARARAEWAERLIAALDDLDEAKNPATPRL